MSCGLIPRAAIAFRLAAASGSLVSSCTSGTRGACCAGARLIVNAASNPSAKAILAMRDLPNELSFVGRQRTSLRPTQVVRVDHSIRRRGRHRRVRLVAALERVGDEARGLHILDERAQV